MLVSAAQRCYQQTNIPLFAQEHCLQASNQFTSQSFKQMRHTKITTVCYAHASLLPDLNQQRTATQFIALPVRTSCGPLPGGFLHMSIRRRPFDCWQPPRYKQLLDFTAGLLPEHDERAMCWHIALN